MNININISNKRPTVIGTPVIVCGNSGYSIDFSFDAEWSGSGLKTARFVYAKGGAVQFQEVAFSGNTVQVPILSDIREVYVGVYAGELRTTTPARIPCDRSILCGGGVHEDPPEDVYLQILQLLNESDLGQFTGHIADKNNPHGVTAEQVGARPSTWMPTAEQVGAVSKTLLWENASPHSNFQRQQIYLPIADYDAIEIVFFTSSSGTDGRHIAQSFYTDTNIDAFTVTRGLLYWVQGFDERTMSREMDISTTGGSGKGYIEFQDAYSSLNGMDNDVTIPVRIYGINGAARDTASDPGTSGGSSNQGGSVVPDNSGAQGPQVGLTLTDQATGRNYKIYVANGKLTMEEV